jgi:adenylate cyclase
MQRRIHLTTGLVLFAFVVSHFLNHALGLLGLPAQEAGASVFYAIWLNRYALGLVVVCFLVHATSALIVLYRRRHLADIRPWEQIQLGLGLSIPPLLIGHLMVASYLPRVHGAYGDYAAVLYQLFVTHPLDGLRQLALLTTVWIHVAIGIWARLRIEPWFPRWRWAIFVPVVALPVAGLAGVMVAGREVVVRFAEVATFRAEATARAAGSEVAARAAAEMHLWLIGGYLALVAGVLLARVARDLAERRRGLVRIGYPDGRAAVVPPGRSLLEASRARRFPHASVCGGRGRCSTCRVRVLAGADNLTPPDAAELRVLTRQRDVGTLRLACQAHVLGDVEIVPLVSPDIAPHAAKRHDPMKEGEERNVAVLFADMRGFTTFAEHRLPYDVVFVLNRFARGMSEAVERSGGRVDKFLGDGLMALFGTQDGGDPCRQALEAALAMQRDLAAMNDQLGTAVGARFRLGVGIHFGPAIVGEIGAGASASVTAIGDTVNIAARLEQLTKAADVPLVVSADVLAQAGLDGAIGVQRSEIVRGRSDPLQVIAISDLGSLAARLGAVRPAV